jgi:transcriptional regulator with XRE-family HTH domain
MDRAGAYEQSVNPQSIYRHIGEVIRTRRKALGMTQETLASKLDISRGSLANIETGRQNVLVHQLYKFGLVLNLEPTDFLPITSNASARLDLAELPLPDDLKKNQKEQIARLIEGIGTSTDQTGEESRARSNRR